MSREIFAGPLARRKLWRFSIAPLSVPLSYSCFPVVGGADEVQGEKCQGDLAITARRSSPWPFCVWPSMTATTEVSVPDRALVRMEALDL